jgi:hypothetical protein
LGELNFCILWPVSPGSDFEKIQMPISVLKNLGGASLLNKPRSWACT